MSSFTARTYLPTPAPEAFAWHERPGALERMSPPWEHVRVIARTGTIHDGDRVTVKAGPFEMEHVHRDYIAGRQFVDEQVRGPFKRFVHTHEIVPDGAGSTLTDSIEYALPFGRLGERYVHARLVRMFRYRHVVLANDLARHAGRPKLRIAITGASGVLGRPLCAFLTTGGHEVVPLVRRAAAPGEIRWDPARGELDAAALEGFDAVIHLAGENAGKKWTDARKREILASRVDGTGLVARTIAKLARPPRVLVSASAIGIYGAHAPEPVDETSALGDDFLADVCKQWEAAAQPAGVRVVNMRLGVVLTPDGGALAEMLPVFRAGLGGPVGSGKQWLSWISVDDALAAIYAALFDDGLRGPINAVAPRAVTNAEFAATLARVLRRPAFARVPAAAIDLAFGEMGRVIALGGVEVLPRRLETSGFAFAFSELEPWLRHVLGKMPPK